MKNSPFTEDFLKSIQSKAAEFAAACYKSDSLNRGYAWSSLSSVIVRVMKEESLHSYKFPSPYNPIKGDKE